jgi:hypothetical protein
LDTVYEKIQELGKHKNWFLLLGLFFLIVLLINGLDTVPEEPYQRLSQNPFTTRTDIHFNNYWQETLVLPLIAYFLGLTGTITFNALTFAIIVGAYSLFAWLAFRRWGSLPSLIFCSLLITSPLTTVLLSWLGTPDGLTVALTIPYLFIHSGILIFLLAFLGTANHPVFIIAIMEILILRLTLRDGIAIKHFIFATGGIIFGNSLVKLFLQSNGIDVISRFDFMRLKSFSEWINMNLENLPGTLFSLFNIHWLILPVCLIMFIKKDKRFFFLVVSMLLLNYGVVFFTLDTTRIFIMTSWPVLFTCIFHSYNLALLESGNETAYRKQYLQALIMIGIISFFTPRYFSWVGELHFTPFYRIISKLIQ